MNAKTKTVNEATLEERHSDIETGHFSHRSERQEPLKK
jgi:hypothetical protein